MKTDMESYDSPQKTKQNFKPKFKATKEHATTCSITHLPTYSSTVALDFKP